MEEKKYLTFTEVKDELGTCLCIDDKFLFEKFYSEEELSKLKEIEKISNLDDDEYCIELSELGDKYFNYDNFRINKAFINYFISNPENLKKYYGITDIDVSDIVNYFKNNQVDDYVDFIKSGIKEDYDLTEEEYNHYVANSKNFSDFTNDENYKNIDEVVYDKIHGFVINFSEKTANNEVTKEDIDTFKNLEEQYANVFKYVGLGMVDSYLDYDFSLVRWADRDYLERDYFERVEILFSENYEKFMCSDVIAKAVGLAVETTFGLTAEKMKFISGLKNDNLNFDCMSSEEEVPLDMIYDSSISDAIQNWNLPDAAYRLDEFKSQFRPSYREFR